MLWVILSFYVFWQYVKVCFALAIAIMYVVAALALNVVFEFSQFVYGRNWVRENNIHSNYGAHKIRHQLRNSNVSCSILETEYLDSSSDLEKVIFIEHIILQS